MARIDESEVRRIARLSRLNLSDDEVRLFAGQLGRIVEYVEQLENVDTAGVEPLFHPLPPANVTREDVPRESLDAETALLNAPEREGPFFRVPKVLDPSAGA